jgi:hypothetical protein
MSERNAVLEPTDQILDLSGSDLCGSKLEGRLLRQGGMRRCEPGPHVVEVSFEQLEGEAHQSRKAHQTVRLLRLESLGFLASVQCSGRNLQELGSSRSRKIEYCSEALERLEGQAFANPGMQLGRVVGP